MGELTLIGLLNFVAADFCESRRSGMDALKSVLVAYSKANDKFGGDKVRNIIVNSPAIELTAVAAVTTKCPDQL